MKLMGCSYACLSQYNLFSVWYLAVLKAHSGSVPFMRDIQVVAEVQSVLLILESEYFLTDDSGPCCQNGTRNSEN